MVGNIIIFNIIFYKGYHFYQIKTMRFFVQWKHRKDTKNKIKYCIKLFYVILINNNIKINTFYIVKILDRHIKKVHESIIHITFQHIHILFKYRSLYLKTNKVLYVLYVLLHLLFLSIIGTFLFGFFLCCTL